MVHCPAYVLPYRSIRHQIYLFWLNVKKNYLALNRMQRFTDSCFTESHFTDKIDQTVGETAVGKMAVGKKYRNRIKQVKLKIKIKKYHS